MSIYEPRSRERVWLFELHHFLSKSVDVHLKYRRDVVCCAENRVQEIM